MGRQAGVALVVVLWMVALMAIMAGSFSLSTQRNTGMVKNAQDRAKSLALADAGVHYAMLMLSQPDPLKRWRSDGRRYRVALPGGEVGVEIIDESGKLDINAASEQTLRALFGKLAGYDQAAALADAVMDWRDPDSLKRASGAEAEDYRAAGKPYGPQNKNFQTLEELQMVLGVKPALYKRLEPMLTIHTGQDGVNPHKASAETLRLLLGLDERAVAEFIERRRAAPANSLPPPLAVPPGPIHLLGGGEVAYTFQARSLTEEGAGAGLQVVAKRQFSRSNGAPFAFVSWKQQIFGPAPAGGQAEAR